MHSAGVVPGDVAAALVRGPSVAPHHVQGRAHYMPGIPVHGVQVGNHAARKFHQGEAQKCPLRVDGPGHVGGVGFLSAGAAGVVSSNISSGCNIRRSPAGLGCLGREHTQGDAGVRTVSRGNFIGQLVSGNAAVHRAIGPLIVFLVGLAVQAILLQTGRLTYAAGDGDGLTLHADQQGLSAVHSLGLELGQALSLPVGTGDDVLKPGQTGVKCFLRVLPDIGDAGNQVGQVDQNAVLVHPAGILQSTAGPAVFGITDLQALSAAVLQQGKGLSGWDLCDLGGPSLGGIDGKGFRPAVPGGGSGHVQLKVPGRGIGRFCLDFGGGRCLSRKGCARQQPRRHDQGHETGYRPFPVVFQVFQHVNSSSFQTSTACTCQR